MLTHFSLFSGIGGIDLAAEWAGFTTVGQCEWADYPTKVLEKHWPDVPRWRDIRDVTAQSFYRKTGLRTVELISGGFPCQPFSTAGKRKGKEDDRYLWPEMLRITSEIKPTWVLGENVAGIINMALDQVLFDLENQGYEVQTFLVPACGVDAPHRRNRAFIVAYSESRNDRRKPRAFSGEDEQKAQERQEKRTSEFGGSSENVADTYCKGLQGGANTGTKLGEGTQPINKQSSRCHPSGNYWATEPDVGRVAHGIPNRVDRLRALGNAVVPQQVYPILKAIAEIETIA